MPHLPGAKSDETSQSELVESLDFVSRKLGALPIINRFFDCLRIDDLLDEFVPHTDQRVTLPPAAGLGVLTRNILVAREPLYGLADWASQLDEGVLRLPRGGVDLPTLQYDSRTDGIFPLIVNESEQALSLKDALLAYTHQPHLERRFHELKSTLDVMHVMLRNPARIEALLFVYFVAFFVEAAIEREIRHPMKADRIPSLPLYPEDRGCSAPTTARIFSLFGDIRRHALVGPEDRVVRWLYDDLNSTQRAVLRLLSIPTAKCFADWRAAP